MPLLPQTLRDWFAHREDVITGLLAHGPLSERDLVNMTRGTLASGSPYLTLYQMVARGLLTCHTRMSLTPGRPPQRVYRLAGAVAEPAHHRAPISHMRRHTVARAA